MSGDRVLVIDDSPAIFRGLRLTLQSLGRIERATVSEDAYAACLDGILAVTDRPPDAVVLDGLDGYSREVLRVCADQGVPVVMFTGEPERYARSGVPVVAKPDVGGLLRALRSVLEA